MTACNSVFTHIGGGGRSHRSEDTVKKDEATQVRRMVNRFFRDVNRLFGGEATGENDCHSITMTTIVLTLTIVLEYY